MNYNEFDEYFRTLSDVEIESMICNIEDGLDYTCDICPLSHLVSAFSVNGHNYRECYICVPAMELVTNNEIYDPCPMLTDAIIEEYDRRKALDVLESEEEEYDRLKDNAYERNL